jgi:cytochrome P450
VTLLLAGHETTATALAWTFSLVLAHPEARAKIEAELRAAGESAGDRELPYLDAAIKESLRLRPIIPIVVRMTKRPVTVNGREIPAGVKASPCVYLTHRRPDLYPEPDAFRPERFLGRKPDPYEWLPFGGGIRRCIGLSFALFEMRVVLATILGEARLAPASAKPPGVRRRGLTLAPSDGCRVVHGGPLRAGAPSST